MTPSKKSKRSRWEVVPMKKWTPCNRVSGEYKNKGLFISYVRADYAKNIRFRVVKDFEFAYVLIAERKVKT